MIAHRTLLVVSMAWLLGLVHAQPLWSTTLTVVNSDFGSPAVPMDGNTTTSRDGDDFVSTVSGAPPGWRISGKVFWSLGHLSRAKGSSFNGLVSAAPSVTDDQVHWANRRDTFLYQVLSTPLAANTTYLLMVDIGDRRDTVVPPGTMIRLGYGDSAGTRILTPASASSSLPPDGGWATWENVYVTDANPVGLGQPLRIELISGGQQVLFDNVRLQALAIPEPGTWVLLASGLLVVAGVARRRVAG
jgi:hypothetical protein